MAANLFLIEKDGDIFDDALANDVVLTLPRQNDMNDPGRLLIGLADMGRSALRVDAETVEGDDIISSNTLHVLGKIGIGTSSAQAPLDIHGDIARLRGLGGKTQFRIFNNSTVLKGGESESIFRAICGTDENDMSNTTDFGCSPCNPMFIRHGDNKRIIIDPEGRVGINILEPEERLHVVGNSIVGGALKVHSHTILSKGTSPAFRIVHDIQDVDEEDKPSAEGEEPREHHAVEVFVPAASQEIPAWVVAGDTGYTGLNTPFPQERLHVNGRARIEDKLDALGGLFVRRPVPDGDDPSSYPIARFFSGSSTSSTLHVGGGQKRIGIATEDPKDTLHVSGSMLTEDAMFTVADETTMDSVQIIPNALEKVKGINGYTFQSKLQNNNAVRSSTGLKAQEVQAVLPEAVKELDDGTLTLAYGNLIGLALQAIRELAEKVDALAL